MNNKEWSLHVAFFRPPYEESKRNLNYVNDIEDRQYARDWVNNGCYQEAIEATPGPRRFIDHYKEF